LLQLKEREEAVKVKVPTGRKISTSLEQVVGRTAASPLLFEDENRVCQNPGPGSSQHWTEEPEQAEVSPWKTVYGSPL